MSSTVTISLNYLFLKCVEPSTIISVLSELSSKNLQVIRMLIRGSPSLGSSVGMGSRIHVLEEIIVKITSSSRNGVVMVWCCSWLQVQRFRDSSEFPPGNLLVLKRFLKSLLAWLMKLRALHNDPETVVHLGRTGLTFCSNLKNHCYVGSTFSSVLFLEVCGAMPSSTNWHTQLYTSTQMWMCG